MLREGGLVEGRYSVGRLLWSLHELEWWEGLDTIQGGRVLHCVRRGTQCQDLRIDHAARVERLVANQDSPRHVLRIFGHAQVGPDPVFVLEAPALSARFLPDVLAGQALGVEATLKVAKAGLEFLSTLHERGRLRALKPRDLLLDESPSWPLQVLPDLELPLGLSGIAVTASRGMIADLPYLPPECVQDSRSVSVAGDLYAFAGVLYHCLAGRSPYPDEGRGTFPILKKLMAADYTPLAEACAETPPGLAEAITRCLATRAADRLPSAESFLRALAD